MFGKLNAVAVTDPDPVPDGMSGSVDEAVARLLEVTEHPKVEKWVQFPKALLLFLVVTGDSESGAFYVYNRRSRVWYWVDFDDEKFGGYSVGDFERLVRECRFLDIVERPDLLTADDGWIVQPGLRPRRSDGSARTQRFA